jgi:hypothetical protein
VPVAPGEQRLWTEEDYDYWIANDHDGTVLCQAMNAGLLAGLGIGRPRHSSSRRR